MGKLTDALERRRKDEAIQAEPLYKMPERVNPVIPPTALEREVSSLQSWNPKLVVLSAPQSIDAEDFRVLRSQILFSKDKKRPRSIMVTSSFPGEGKTYVTANLAVSIALGIDEHVLLIDCDLRKPNLHNMLGYSPSEGLHEYLTGQKTLPELIIQTKIAKLSFLPAGSVPPNPTELLSSGKMEDFLDEVRNRYDDRFVVIDSTPSQVTAETAVLARHVDGIVLVAKAQKSPKDAIARAINNLGREKILGLVFNGYDKANKSYNKYYKKYYSK